jgi:hypothetical protein
MIPSIDEFNREWRVVDAIKPVRLTPQRRDATTESIGSPTRIEGSKRIPGPGLAIAAGGSGDALAH